MLRKYNAAHERPGAAGKKFLPQGCTKPAHARTCTVLNYKRLTSINLKIMLAFGYISGVFSAMALSDNEEFDYLSFFSEYLIDLAQSGFSRLFGGVLTVLALLSIAILILSFCALGFAVIPFIPFFCGAIFGALAGFLYYFYMRAGIVLFSAAILPFFIVYSVFLLNVCGNGCAFSLEIMKKIAKKESFSSNIACFFYEFAKNTAICVFCAAAQCYIVKMLSGYISLIAV